MNLFLAVSSREKAIAASAIMHTVAISLGWFWAVNYLLNAPTASGESRVATLRLVNTPPSPQPEPAVQTQPVEMEVLEPKTATVPDRTYHRHKPRRVPQAIVPKATPKITPAELERRAEGSQASERPSVKPMRRRAKPHFSRAQARAVVASVPKKLGAGHRVLPSEFRRLEGVVILRVEVAADGRVSNVAVHRSSGFTQFDVNAVEAVQKWRYRPGTLDGTAEEMKILQPVRFRLRRR